MGRKNKYESHVKPFLKEIPKWYRTQTETQIIKRLGISMPAWIRYKNDYPELANCLIQSKQALAEHYKSVLRKKADGFFYTEVKTTRYVGGEHDGEEIITTHKKYAEPDTGALHLLLKNNDDEWRNDDKETMELKKKQLALQEKKIEADAW
jgi:hypothetical protein